MSPGHHHLHVSRGADTGQSVRVDKEDRPRGKQARSTTKLTTATQPIPALAKGARGRNVSGAQTNEGRQCGLAAVPSHPFVSTARLASPQACSATASHGGSPCRRLCRRFAVRSAPSFFARGAVAYLVGAQPLGVKSSPLIHGLRRGGRAPNGVSQPLRGWSPPPRACPSPSPPHPYQNGTRGPNGQLGARPKRDSPGRFCLHTVLAILAYAKSVS